MLEPRPYQIEAVNSVFEYFRDGGKSGLVVVPTGGGKSLIQTMIIKPLIENQKDMRILALTHKKELIEQNEKELLNDWPEAPTGVFSAGLKRKELKAQILFAGIQSIHKHVHKIHPPPRLLLIDECHLMSHKDSTMYGKTFQTLKLMNPEIKIIGLTATPFRLDSGWLHTGEDAIFERIIYDVKIPHLINNGWLCRPTAKHTKTEIDVSSVAHRGGDFLSTDLQKTMMDGDNTPHAVAEIIEKGKDRKKWLIFCTGVAHAEQVKEELEKSGVESNLVTGSTPRSDRDSIVEEFRKNEKGVLINVEVFTTGFNVPDVDLLAMLRPTESPGLYLQMIGRGMRIAPGKKDCLVLDFAGNVMRHGPVDAVIIRDKSENKGLGEPPAKECPDCYSIIHAGFKECPDCGYLFPEAPPMIAKTASEKALLQEDQEPIIFEVQKTEFSIHEKPGKPPSVKVTYYCGINTVSQWIAPEAQNLFYYNRFCANAGIEKPYPLTAEEFCFWVIAEAEEITVVKDKQYFKVLKTKWRKNESE
jgi:DNA repair protein RadD